MKFTLEFIPSEGVNWPSITIFNNNIELLATTIKPGQTVVSFEFDDQQQPSVNIVIQYNKTQNETVIDQGTIIKDQSLELVRCWVDDILMEPWFLTEGIYYPEYFAGFLEHALDAPALIKSQFVWHFPGKFVIQYANPFWNWYSQQRKIFSQVCHVDKDLERWENYTGSFDSHQEIVDEIYRLLNV